MQARMWCDQYFQHHAVAGSFAGVHQELGVDVESGLRAQGIELVEWRGDADDIAGADRVGTTRPQTMAIADQFDDGDAVILGEARFAQGLVDQRRIRTHTEVGHIVADTVTVAKAAIGVARQQPASKHHHEHCAGQRQRQSDLAQFEHRERTNALGFGDVTDQDVRRGADQRADAAELGSVGQRDQQFRRRDLAQSRRGQHQRQKDRNRGGVVHERGDRADQQHHHQQQQPGPFAGA